MTTLFALSLIGTFAAMQVHKNGIELGKKLGDVKSLALFLLETLLHSMMTDANVNWQQDLSSQFQ